MGIARTALCTATLMLGLGAASAPARAATADAALRAAYTAIAVDDETICATIRSRWQQYGEVFCPHTATAVHVLETLRAEGMDGDWAVAATAHPAKFESVVEPLVGHAVEVPPALAELLARPAQATPVPPEYAALQAHLLD